VRQVLPPPPGVTRLLDQGVVHHRAAVSEQFPMMTLVAPW